MNKYDAILHLKRPKLLNNGIVNLSDIDPVLSFSDDTVDQLSYQGAKSVKKSKVEHTKSLDFSDDKKNKLRQNKRLSNKIYVSKNIADINDELDISDLSSAPFLKNSKSLKGKKSLKNKIALDRKLLPEDGNTFNSIYLADLLTVQNLAEKLHVPTADIIKWLFLQGISVTVNQLLDLSISTLVAKHYSFTVLSEGPQSDNVSISCSKIESGCLRAPVVTLLGHVDHGKTTLLKAIQKANSPVKEAGNITQAIGSYEIFIDHPEEVNKLIFLDTPGHEAFVDMRRRGVDITDLVVLVVAANDGLQPQTIEAINHIRKRSLPFIIAINKIDKPEANINEVKRQLLESDIIRDLEDASVVPISALTGQNVDKLLSALLNLSKKQNLRSDASRTAQGTIIEAYLDKRKGPVAQLLVQNGTLYTGDIIIAGQFYGKTKAIYNSLGKKVDFIESAALADVLCFSKVPGIGLSFEVVANEKTAKILSSNYRQLNTPFTMLHNRISLEDIGQPIVKRIIKQVNFIIKTDVQGSIDAIVHALSIIPQDKVQINLLLVAVGEISCKDIQLAVTTDSKILAFNLNISSSICHHAEKMGVSLEKFNVIYDLTDNVKSYMLEFVDLDYEKKILGHAEVKDLFFVNKYVVAGCFVYNGQLRKRAYFQLKRKGDHVYVGLLDSLKRLKEDVDFVNTESECGIMCKDYNLWQIGDVLECYDLHPLKKTL